MTQIFNCFFFSCFLLSASTLWANPPALLQRINSELSTPYDGFIPNDYRNLASYHIVFVDGIMNESADLIGVYFTDNIAELQELGISYSHLGYSSLVSIPYNANTLVSDLENIARKVKKPIILVGHSMGGGESLYAILRKPELMLSHKVEKVILLEAAIGGSLIANSCRMFAQFLGIDMLLGEGLKCLRQEVARANFSVLYPIFVNRLDSASREDISKRVFYVRSSIPSHKSLSWGLQTVRAFFDPKALQGTQNDGLLTVENQILGLFPEFGVDLGIIPGDHIEWVVSGIFSKSTEARRRAFTRALLQSVFDDPTELNRLAPPRPLWE